ncbi:hypothetical protein ABZT04_02145 [Streptomyces sp. NPDC005492]|uniref:hypothetical protein n=1 Tax=Streptomyces sp. NPDC005492 TaxID=3156883 RepID=UPI0033BF0AA4
MPNAGFAIGSSVVITDGPFATFRATITGIEIPSQKARGVIDLFGSQVRVELASTDSSSELRVTATQDRSEIIAAHADATRYYGIAGRIASGKDAGRYVRVDRRVGGGLGRCRRVVPKRLPPRLLGLLNLTG